MPCRELIARSALCGKSLNPTSQFDFTHSFLHLHTKTQVYHNYKCEQMKFHHKSQLNIRSAPGM